MAPGNILSSPIEAILHLHSLARFLTTATPHNPCHLSIMGYLLQIVLLSIPIQVLKRIPENAPDANVQLVDDHGVEDTSDKFSDSVPLNRMLMPKRQDLIN